MTDLETRPVHAETIAYSHSGHLSAVRSFVRSRAGAIGLVPDRAEVLALVVCELATNTLQHTADGGEVHIWAADGRLTCDVVDSGAERVFGRPMPAPEAEAGRGLPIIEQLCDDVTSIAGDGYTIVRLRFPI